MPTKRPGSPYWYATYTDASGKRRKVSTGETSKRRAAEIETSWRRESRDERQHGKRWRLSEVIQTALDEHYARLAPATLHRAYHAGNALLAGLGDPYVDEVSRATVNSYRRDRQAGTGTVIKELQVLSRAVKHVNDHFDAGLTDPTKGAMPPKPPLTVKYLTDDELAALLDAATAGPKVAGYLPDMILLAVNLGLRHRECVRLRWEQIDLGRRQMRFEGDQSKSRRLDTVPINSTAAAVLRRRAVSCGRSEWVFPVGRDGGPVHSIKRALQFAFARAGIEGRDHMHVLRHTYATRLVQAGVDFRTVQELMRHRDIRTTTIYANVTAATLQGAAEAVATVPTTVHISCPNMPNMPKNGYSQNEGNS